MARKTKDDARAKKKEYDRKRRENMKNDPIKLQQLKDKERQKYLKKREKSVVSAKLVSDMTDRERQNIQKEWGKKGHKITEKIKKGKLEVVKKFVLDNSPPLTPPHEPSTSNLNIEKNNRSSSSGKAGGYKKVKRNRSKMYRKVKELEKNLSLSNKRAEKYKKRCHRLKNKYESKNSKQEPLTPRSKVNKILESEKVSPSIRKRLVFCEVMTQQLKLTYKSMSKEEKNKRKYFQVLKSNIFRKYRLMSTASKEGVMKRKSAINSENIATRTLPRGHSLYK